MKNSQLSKHIALAVIASVLGLILFAVVFAVPIILLSESSVIEDINGSSTALAVITEEEILSKTSNHTSKNSRWRYDGGNTNVSRSLEEYDYDEYHYSCSHISGIATLQVTNIDSDVLRIHVESTLEEGNMEIYIIVDDEIYEKIEAGATRLVTLEGIAGKNVFVKMAGESARVSVSVTREYDTMKDT